jgi:predicted acetyltransferase
MKKIYKCSKGGWNGDEKREEMFESSAYYLIAYDQDKPVGFCHFRFDMDYGSQVVYCYELQVEAQKRKHGLGNFLMQILEDFCEKLKLEKVILTCYKHNTVGQRFFREKMHYEIDETDPNEDMITDPDYVILSKCFE